MRNLLGEKVWQNPVWERKVRKETEWGPHRVTKPASASGPVEVEKSTIPVEYNLASLEKSKEIEAAYWWYHKIKATGNMISQTSPTLQ